MAISIVRRTVWITPIVTQGVTNTTVYSVAIPPTTAGNTLVLFQWGAYSNGSGSTPVAPRLGSSSGALFQNAKLVGAVSFCVLENIAGSQTQLVWPNTHPAPTDRTAPFVGVFYELTPCQFDVFTNNTVSPDLAGVITPSGNDIIFSAAGYQLGINNLSSYPTMNVSSPFSMDFFQSNYIIDNTFDPGTWNHFRQTEYDEIGCAYILNTSSPQQSRWTGSPDPFTILGVHFGILQYALKEKAPTISLTATGTVDHIGTAQTIPGTTLFQYMSPELLETDPSTGAAWTAIGMTATLFGAKFG
jgi:hypothetical protein